MTVKERLKKFYHDHENTIKAFTAGVTVTTIVGLRILSNTKEGLKPHGVYLYGDKDGQPEHLAIDYKNGQTKFYDWIPTEPLK